MGSIAGLVFLTVSLCLLLPPTSALKCWHNSDHTPAATWSIQECDVEKNETACLLQYRLYNGQQLPSFSGCHTPKMRCNYCCDPTEGQDNDFSCCCSGDLCNEFHPPRPHCGDPIIGICTTHTHTPIHTYIHPISLTLPHRRFEPLRSKGL